MAEIRPELVRIAARQVRVWRNSSTKQAPNLLLLHGGFGDANWHWHTVWQDLADSYYVAAPDLPHFGGTVELPNATFAELIEWLARVQELIGMTQAAVIGNSFGATLARLYASAHPERVTHLILVDGGQIPRKSTFAQRILRTPALASLTEWSRRQSVSEEEIQRAFANPALVTPDVLRASQDASHSFAALRRQIAAGAVPQQQTPRAPTLLIWGEQDRLANKQRAFEIASELDSAELPEIQLAIIRKAGHMPQLEDPASFVKIVREFVT